MRPSKITVLVIFAAIAGLFACGDDVEPRAPNPSMPGDFRGISTSGADTGDDFDDEEPDGSDEEDDGVYCDLVPDDEPGDERYPCCFSDADCQDSDVADSELMYCYYADCANAIQGVCRIAPTHIDDCYDDLDCPVGETCPYEQEPELFDCTEPTLVESPSMCILE